ncbi:phosphoribosyltransferase family protein [Caldivirga maquilingensis]|uniref:Phosphoribosyltransferase n=1 Tax=Caldivirga maquilingensis (strain ATCC 700844 / DSM 13496 / JCM 10307 / IC-167) TaxID=397948 RepID=A8M9H1_CALMQ|nr:phosphoribosyltransferase family protein [Caldivirga maquilingensis]ABW02390.1 phosphoribosyltransferase [Caldivirga maquilingensis IC-167]
MLNSKRVVKYNGEAAYSVTVAGLRRLLPIIEIGEVTISNGRFKAYIASDSELVLGDVEFINAVSRELANLVRIHKPEVIVTPEAKAIALAYGVSRELGIGRFVVARKSVKAYMGKYVHVKVNSITTKGDQFLVLDSYAMGYVSNRNVCIVDDVVSTGGTINALEELMRISNAHVVCKAAIWIEGPWINDEEVLHLGELPIFIA